MSHLEEKLKKRNQEGNYRTLTTCHNLVDFSSNDYLGLARSELLKIKIDENLKDDIYPLKIGSTGSRLLTGNSEFAEQLESKIAAFHGYESGILFNCGYMANVGLMPAISNQDSIILFDRDIHASMHDGIRLSHAKAYPFRHNDVEHLEHRLRHCPRKADCFICIESVYSTDGSQAPLPAICQLAKRYDAKIVLDEAHSVGLIGPQGRGLASSFHLTSSVYASITTFGKALGVFGAAVVCEKATRAAIINFAHSFIYTTALPHYVMAAISASYDLFPFMDQERKHVFSLITSLKNLTASQSHIQPIMVPGNSAAREAAEYLKLNKLDVRPLLSPTVQRGYERLRVCLHAFNTFEELNLLLEAIESLREAYA